MHMVALEELKGIISTGQTGHFPIFSIMWMQYIMVLYNYDSNAILAQAYRSCIGQKIVDNYNKVYKCLQKAVVIPVIQQIDNEVSNRLIKSIEEKNLDYQVASPHDHYLNPVKRAMQIFKNHLISNLHGCYCDFPFYCWS